MVKVKPVPNVPRLHETPIAIVQHDCSGVVVDLDDENEIRFRRIVFFSP